MRPCPKGKAEKQAQSLAPGIESAPVDLELERRNPVFLFHFPQLKMGAWFSFIYLVIPTKD